MQRTMMSVIFMLLRLQSLLWTGILSTNLIHYPAGPSSHLATYIVLYLWAMEAIAVDPGLPICLPMSSRLVSFCVSLKAFPPSHLTELDRSQGYTN